MSIYLSIVIPAYNEAPILDQFLPQLYSALVELPDQQEIVIVDDGSRDNLREVFQAHLAACPAHIALRLVQLSRNFGKEAALSAGLANTQGRIVAMMDADGQHPISVLQEMLALNQQGIDMVVGVQANRQHESWLSRSLKRGFYHFMQDTHRYEIKPNAGDFRLMSRKVVDALLALPERQRFMKGLYAWVGFKTVYVPFEAHERQDGESKFNYASLFELALTGITSFSQKPLRWISRMGLLVSALSLMYGFYIVFDTLFFGKEVAGWATLVAGLMFSAGVQLICLGVIGEYIGRIYDEVKQRPLYVIDQIWEGDSST